LVVEVFFPKHRIMQFLLLLLLERLIPNVFMEFIYVLEELLMKLFKFVIAPS